MAAADGQSLETARIVVIGGGQAAQSLVETLRSEGHRGAITLIGAEAHPPYQRPPLSKKYLAGDFDRARLFFRPETWFAENAVELRLGARAAKIDRAARAVTLADGESVPYDGLALVTGAEPKRLPEAIGGRLPGVHVVRDVADVDALAGELRSGGTALVVGGGYIGLETAASLRLAGMEVALIEAAPRVLARVASAETAAQVAALHRSKGVDLREGAGLARFVAGEDGRVATAVLSDGSEIKVDLAVVGVGVAPRTELAEAAGLDIDNGVAVDAAARTSDPSIVAAGDVASFEWRGRRIRLESVQNAIDQGAVAARALLGGDPVYDPTPWFWSDQYDLKLQIVGLGDGATRIVARAGAREGALSHWYFGADGRLQAVDALSDPRAYMTAKRWLEAGLSPDADDIADPSKDLKTIAAV